MDSHCAAIHQVITFEDIIIIIKVYKRININIFMIITLSSLKILFIGTSVNFPGSRSLSHWSSSPGLDLLAPLVDFTPTIMIIIIVFVADRHTNKQIHTFIILRWPGR